MTAPYLTVLLAGPRGFCAGVDRAIQIVERALGKYGAPVYVRHEIVHNRFVVEMLEAKGAVFVEELTDVPDNAPVVFSAHGVPKTVPAEAEQRAMLYLDATCPLVSKVHREAEQHFEEGRRVILVGHAGHPEVIGTMGQLPPGAILLVESVEDAERIAIEPPERLAYITQTTLSVDDTAAIVAVLRRRFPAIRGPSDALLVIGAPNSSNSRRLVEVARRSGCERAALIQRAAEIDWGWLDGVACLGLTAGASAPERLVEEVVDALRQRYRLVIEEVAVTRENVVFKLPRALAG
jgi:4-hydroxy-3-methylbut-2-enyl diphosphate reductase